jgi:hypothetical protein
MPAEGELQAGMEKLAICYLLGVIGVTTVPVAQGQPVSLNSLCNIMPVLDDKTVTVS